MSDRVACWVMVALLAVAARAAAAQEGVDPATTARLRLGPIALNPTLAVSNIGVDSNVFNESESPRSDFTATLSPQTEIYLRVGRARFDGRTKVDLVYFRKYSTERSTNGDYQLRFEVPLNRLKPFVTEQYLTSRARPGYEIDARARHRENRFGVGLELRVGTKTAVTVEGLRGDLEFEGDEVFRGTNLSEALNRTDRALRTSVTVQLTPLTRFAFRGERQTDRFDNRFRDADSVRVSVGVEFDPLALVNGSAYVGYRTLDFLSDIVPDSRGGVAQVGLGYTLLGDTRFVGTVQRDVQYSYDVTQPYYVQTGISGTVTQRLVGRIDGQAVGGRQRLAYRAALGAGLPLADRVDYVTTYGGGVGYRLGRDARLGFLIERYRRRSPVDFRVYEGYRAGMSVTYGTGT